MSPTPKTCKAWIVTGTTDFDCLKKDDKYVVPELGEHDVLVRFRGASLNYRDLVILRGEYPFPMSKNVVAASDGAGDIVGVGPKVERFKVGQKVVTLFNQTHLSGSLDLNTIRSGTGGVIDGTLREYGVFSQEGLVLMPENLNYLEGATLTCAGLTAWNALYGLKQLMPGDYVLTQGTGGVSMFAVQFAKAAGAIVIATTSSAEKEKKLKALGADHVINYKTTPNWGEVAKNLTHDKEGVHHVVEIGGPATMSQSLKAVKIDGVITVIGFVAKEGEKQPGFMDVLTATCTVRGLLVGNRSQMDDMNRAIVANNIHPVLDEKVFTLDDVRKAYDYQWSAGHVGKVCIKID